MPERLSPSFKLLSGLDHVVQEHTIQALLALTPEDLQQHPHLYLQRLLTIPQLPAPKAHQPDIVRLSPEEQQLVALPETRIHEYERDEIAGESQYLTSWGCFTFEQLYDQTCRYATYLLKSEFHGAEEHVEDALQAGYLKLWEKLQQDPHLLAQRKIGSVARQIFYGALHTHHREHVVQKRHPSFTQLDRTEGGRDGAEPIVIYSSTSIRSHSNESRQADQRIDLHRAIAAVANEILAQPAGCKQDRALWALYSITMLHVCVTEASHLFRVDGKVMTRAYDDVRQMLQHQLHNYAPRQPTRPVHAKGQKELPSQDITAIRQQNGQAKPEHFERVQQQLEEQHSDTYERDLLALNGIQNHIPARELARSHDVPASSMQRAYERVHLLLGSLLSSTVTQRRPEKKRSTPFVFTPERAPLIQSLAQDLLAQPDNEGWLVALYAYLCNLPIRTTAQNFNLKESTLRRYRQSLQDRMAALSASAKLKVASDILNSVEPVLPKQSDSVVTVLLPHQGISFSSEETQDLKAQDRSEPLYQTRWRGQMTFEDLFTDRDVRNVAFSKMRSLGYDREDAEDVLQLGALNLWKCLREQPTLLCDKGAAWVGVWMALSGSRRALLKHNSRSVVFDHSVQHSISGGEETGTDSYLSGSPERWAGFATRIDERIDFALLMSALAQRYDGDPIKLFALYSLTTSVKMKDVLSVAKAHKNQFIGARQAVKQDLRELLEQDTEGDVEDEFWTKTHQDQYESVGRVAEQVIDDTRLLLALYVTTTSAKRKDIIELFKLRRTGFRKDITRIKMMLTEEIRRSKPLRI